jgi:quinolinate synthase
VNGSAHIVNASGTTLFHLQPELPICQTDLPLDWYQEEFKPYAEEYLALPDRKPATVFAWLDRYVEPARAHFGDELLLLAHFYMGGEIVQLVERYGGLVSDSYQLALQARNHPEKRVIVESAVHFMAEAIAILAHEHQQVWITNPKAGCTMEMLAKDFLVLPVADQLVERYGDSLATVAYMNTGGRLKALAGRTGGAACTSSNAHQVVAWAKKQGKRVFFVPDEHLGRNTAHKLGIAPERVVALPDPRRGQIQLGDVGLERLDRAEMILWGSSCGVHTIFTPAMVRFWNERGYACSCTPSRRSRPCWPPTARAARTTCGSASRRRRAARSSRSAPRALRAQRAREGEARGVEVVHLADVPGSAMGGCGCATMSRNDPPHLAGMLDLLRRGRAPEINRVLAGDVMNERTLGRDRLSPRSAPSSCRRRGWRSSA